MKVTKCLFAGLAASLVMCAIGTYAADEGLITKPSNLSQYPRPPPYGPWNKTPASSSAITTGALAYVYFEEEAGAKIGGEVAQQG
jgi:hypothetical protein